MQKQMDKDIDALSRGKIPTEVAQTPASPMQLTDFIAPTAFMFEDGKVPMMPCKPNEPTEGLKHGIAHRQKFSPAKLGIPALVAKPIPRKDWAGDILPSRHRKRMERVKEP